MKKLLISALAAVGIAAISLPAFALEHEFGGYWRTRAYTQQDFLPAGQKNVTQVDTRTRLYYTAKFSENFKFVNKFEFNTTWGEKEGRAGGGIGADGRNDFRIKNSYVDLTFCDWNLKVGIQGGTYARGFMFDDDFSGISLTYNGNGFKVPMVWIKATEGNSSGRNNDYDVDALLLAPIFEVGQASTVQPFFMYVRSDDVSQYASDYADYYDYSGSGGYGGSLFPTDAEETNLFYLGLNADVNVDALNLWFTGIYSFGTIDRQGGGEDYDVSAFLVALGGAYDFGMFDIHAQGFYASGDDDDDNDIDTFVAPIGQSYYWSEIMGYKTFDNRASWNSPNERIANLWAVNLGTVVKPAERWTLEGDVWYAQRAENVEMGYEAGTAKELGTEIDLAATYQIFDNMNIRFVGAYLFAGDATGDDDPWLLGTQLEFSF